jgi:hypothetical protein
MSEFFYIITNVSVLIGISQQSLLERIFGSKEKSLTPEELKARKEEENLFSGLSRFPTILSKTTDETDAESPSSTSKKRRTDK